MLPTAQLHPLFISASLVSPLQQIFPVAVVMGKLLSSQNASNVAGKKNTAFLKSAQALLCNLKVIKLVLKPALFSNYNQKTITRARKPASVVEHFDLWKCINCIKLNIFKLTPLLHSHPSNSQGQLTSKRRERVSRDKQWLENGNYQPCQPPAALSAPGEPSGSLSHQSLAED